MAFSLICGRTQKGRVGCQLAALQRCMLGERLEGLSCQLADLLRCSATGLRASLRHKMGERLGGTNA
eukprot:364882-Chlamydomonas_euryale.AAC.8